MKIILNSKESDWLAKYLNSDIKIKTITFKKNNIYVADLAKVIIRTISNSKLQIGYSIENDHLFLFDDFEGLEGLAALVCEPANMQEITQKYLIKNN